MGTRPSRNDLRRFNLVTLRKEAARLGATVDWRRVGHWNQCNLDAPQGKRWSCNRGHSLVAVWQDDDHSWIVQAIADALSRMAYGLEDCDDPDCDICEGAE